LVLNSLMRFFCGSVRFQAVNGFGERLINLCATNNVGLTNLRKVPGGFKASVPAYDYKKVEVFAQKANVDVSVIKNKGLPFKLKRFKKRWGLMIGVIAFLFIIIFSQNIVWEIDIKGNEKVPDSIIKAELKSIGVHKGSYIPKLDLDTKNQEALIKLPQLSWLSLTKSGCRIQVEVSERYISPTIKEGEPCDIIARKTGQIRYMEVYNGIKVIGLNYTVNKGDLIVSGEFVNKFEKATYVHSDAKIIAEVQFDKTLELDIEQLSKQYTGKVKKRNHLEIGDLKLPLFIATKVKGEYDIESQSTPIRFFSKKLPISFYKQEYSFYDKKGKQMTQNEAQKILEEKFKEYERYELKDCAIINRKPNSMLKNGVFTMKMSYTVEEDIAEKRQINAPPNLE